MSAVAAVRAVDVRAELADPALPRTVEQLGFRAEDAADLFAALDRLTVDDLGRVQHFADRLLPQVGRLPAGGGDVVWEGLGDAGNGLVPMLALLATAGVVMNHHGDRGISRAGSLSGLADLGQQVAVHRMVHGRFGLETYGWLAGHAWTGSLFWFGRLQLDLERVDAVAGPGQDWVLGTHIPRSGPLTPDAVDASLAAARAFFARHFADVPAHDVHCSSWLLDPRLSTLLPGSNLARFAERWETYGEPQPGDADVAYFAFAHRGPLDPSTLVATTALQRAVLSVWEAGEQWHVVQGRLPR